MVLRVRNYMGFSDWLEVDTKELTVLTGQNSSGKSSIVKALDLISSQEDILHLDFSKVHYSPKTFKEAVTDNNDDITIDFELIFSKIFTRLDIDDLISEEENENSKTESMYARFNYKLYLSYGRSWNNRSDIADLKYLKLLSIDNNLEEVLIELENSATIFRCHINKKKIIAIPFVYFKIRSNDYYREERMVKNRFISYLDYLDNNQIKIDNYKQIREDAVELELHTVELSVEKLSVFDGVVSDKVEDNIEIVKYLDKPQPIEPFMPIIEHVRLQDMIKTIIDINKQYGFLSISCKNMEIEKYISLFTNEIDYNSGCKHIFFENIYSYYIFGELREKIDSDERTSDTKFIHFDYYNFKKEYLGNKEFQKEINRNIKEYLGIETPFLQSNSLFCRCLEILGVCLYLNTSDIDTTANERNLQLKKLQYEGTGIKQLLSWIIQLTYILPQSKITNIIYLEEPEVNLHPALQSKLADVLVYLANEMKYEFIVETHSEYIIRKLQVLVAESNIANNIKIYYFADVGGIKNRKEISILKNGRLSSELGSGFFDESSKLLRVLWNQTQWN